MMEGMIELYAAGVGCGVLLSFIPFAFGAVIKLALDIMKKGGC